LCHDQKIQTDPTCRDRCLAAIVPECQKLAILNVPAARKRSLPINRKRFVQNAPDRFMCATTFPGAGTAARDAIAVNAATTPWPGMWRYRAVLPDVTPVTLGEGWTPMLRSKRYANAFVKEEGANPTGSFKARGLALAVTMARHYG